MEKASLNWNDNDDDEGNVSVESYFLRRDPFLSESEGSGESGENGDDEGVLSHTFSMLGNIFQNNATVTDFTPFMENQNETQLGLFSGNNNNSGYSTNGFGSGWEDNPDWDQFQTSPTGNWNLDINNNNNNNISGGGGGESAPGQELYDVPLSIIVLLSLLYGGISVAALIGNMLVLWVVTVSRKMRTVTNMFIANLALGDIIIGLFTIPFQFQAALLQRWNLPDFMCAFCPFVQVLSVNVSVFTLSAIAVDRYRAVLFPLSARVSKRKATWVILSIWSVGLLLALPTELDYKVIYVAEKGTTMKPFCTNLGLSSTFRLYYTLGLVVIQYFFPLVIITGAYAHMATQLWGATAPGNKEESRDAVVLRNKKKVIKMLALVVLLFALCWLPLQTYNFLGTLFPTINNYQYINIIWFCSHWLAMSNSCCNPFIYAIYNDKFQREFRSRLWCLRFCCCLKIDHEMRRGGYGFGSGGCQSGGGVLVPTYSECSDFDRSKIRINHKGRNNGGFGGGMTTTSTQGGSSQSFYDAANNKSRRSSCSITKSSPTPTVVVLCHHPNQQRMNQGISYTNNNGRSESTQSLGESEPFTVTVSPKIMSHHQCPRSDADYSSIINGNGNGAITFAADNPRTKTESIATFSSATNTNASACSAATVTTIVATKDSTSSIKL